MHGPTQVLKINTSVIMAESQSSTSASDEDLKKELIQSCGKGLATKDQSSDKAQKICKLGKKLVTSKGGNVKKIFHHLKQKTHNQVQTDS